MKIAEAIADLLRDELPVRLTAYDGSSAGPPDAEFGLELATQRGLSYMLTAPGDLGMARAYVSGDLILHGVHPGNPYDAMVRAEGPPRLPHAVGGRAGRAGAWARRGQQPQAAAPAAAGAPAALAPGDGGAAPLDDPRRRGDPSPLRRLQRVLPPRARALDGLHLRGLPARRRHPRGGAVREVRPRRAQARPQARPAAARRRLRLGRHGPPRRQGVRRQGARRDPVGAAGVVGQGGDRPRRPG